MFLTDYSVSVCVVLKGVSKHDHMSYFRDAPFRVTNTQLRCVTDVHRVANDFLATKGGQLSVFFVDTVPSSEHLIPLFCSLVENELHFIVREEGDPMYVFSHIFGIMMGLLKHRELTERLSTENAAL